MEKALSADLLKAPSKTPTPQSAHQTKHCRYHRNFGHTTGDCWALKDKIEELIQAGHLRHFVQTSWEDGRIGADVERSKKYGGTPRRMSDEAEKEETADEPCRTRANKHDWWRFRRGRYDIILPKKAPPSSQLCILH